MSDYYEGNSEYAEDQYYNYMDNRRTKMAKKYPQIGSMIQKKDKATGAPVLDANGKATYYIKVDKNTDVKINGVKVDGFLNISRPRDKFDRMLERGTITAAEHAEKIGRFEKGGDLDYIQFEVSCTIEE